MEVKKLVIKSATVSAPVGAQTWNTILITDAGNFLRTYSEDFRTVEWTELKPDSLNYRE